MGKKSFQFISLSLLVGMVFTLTLVSCGGGSGSPTTEDTSGLTISGTLTAPASGSVSLNAPKSLSLSAKADVTESPAAAEGMTATLYTLEGTKVAEDTVDSSGGCEFDNIETSAIKPSDETGTSYNAELVLIADNADGTVHLEAVVEAEVVEGTTTTISLSSEDDPIGIDETLAAKSLFSKFSCVIGQKCTVSGIDPACYVKLQKKIFEGGSNSGSGLSSEMGKMKDMIGGAMAQGLKPSDYGYDDWSEMMEAHLSGELSSDAQSAMAGAAATTTGGSASDFSGYSSYVSSFSSMDSVVGTQLAGGEGLTAVASLSNKSVSLHSKESADSGSACDNIKSSDDYAESLANLWESAEDADGLLIYADDDCMKVAIGIMEEYNSAGDMTQMKQGGAAVQGFMAGMTSTDCDGYFEEDGTFDSSDFDGMKEMFDQMDFSNLDSFDKLREWGESWEGTIENASGGWDFYCPEGNCDSDEIAYYTGYFFEQLDDPDYDPGTINFDSLQGQLETQYSGFDDSIKTAFDTCVAAGGTFTTCSGGVTAPDSGGFVLTEQQLLEQQQQQQQQQPQGFGCTSNSQCGVGGTCNLSTGLCEFVH